MRAVIDTNVLVSGFTSPHGTPAQLIFLWLADAYDLTISEHILTEIERTLKEPYFAQRLTAEEQRANIALLRREADTIMITAEIQGIAPSPADDLVLATAVSARADYLVTGDRRLRAVDSYEDVKVVSPREFLDILEASLEN